MKVFDYNFEVDCERGLFNLLIWNLIITCTHVLMIKSLFSTCLNYEILFNSYEALVGVFKKAIEK